MAQKNIILTNGNITETTYNDEKIDYLVLFENLKDANGNPRFIEGNITPPTLTSVTFTDTKWSLSGTHLMIVLAGTLSAKIASEELIINVGIPQWIKDKIHAINGTLTPLASIVSASARDVGVAFDSPKFALDKNSSTSVVIYNIDELNSTNSSTYVLRVQFDLLIDNE